MLPVAFVILTLMCSVNCYSSEFNHEDIMQKIRFMFPYCRIGADQDGAGVYFAPFAAWKFGELATYGTPLEHEAFDHFIEEMILGDMHDGGRSGAGITFILDCAGLDLNDLFASNALEFSMKMYARSGDYARVVKNFLIINMALPSQSFGTIWNPLLGDLWSRTHLYGTNPADWVPHLRAIIPYHVLLQGYGGANPMPPECNRGETRRPFRFPTAETFGSAVSFIARNSVNLTSAGVHGFPRATGNFSTAFTGFFG